MREIKFRAKSLNGDLVYFSLYEVTNYYPSDSVFYVGGIPCQVGSEEQYTGLRDKNGKKIYEGDILCYGMWSDGSGKCLYKVFWNEEDARFDTLDLRHGQEMTHLDTFGAEVIGNIYENPELLTTNS